MKILSKIIIFLLTLFAFAAIIGFVFNFSLVFPFTISNDFHDFPEHRLHMVRLGTAATFAYFGLRYIFFQTTKLYPIQFMGIFLFFLATVGFLSFFKYQVPLSEYSVSIFFLITSLIIYQA